MRRLSWLGSRSAAHNKGRTALAAAGVLLGVALLFGVLVANASISAALDRMFALPDRADVVVRSVDRAPLTPEVLAQAASLPGVAELVPIGGGAEAELLIVGATSEEWMAAHGEALGPGVEVAERAAPLVMDEYRPFLDTIGRTLTAFSAVALFVGGFFVYLSFSASVMERVRLYGILRALGATPRQVRGLVLREAGLIASVASIGGLALGSVMATALVHLQAGAANLAVPPTVIRSSDAAVAVGVGLVTAMASAWVPARQAARLDPVAAIRGDERAQGRPPRAWPVGVALIAAGAAVTVANPSPEVTSAATVPVLAGTVLVVPTVVRPLASLVGRVTGRLAAGTGSIAVMHLVRERTRSASALAVVMAVLAMAHALATSTSALRQEVDRVFTTALGDTILVRSPFLDMPMPDAPGPDAGAAAAAALGQIDGVDALTTVRYGRAAVAGRTTSVVVIDPATYFEVSDFLWRDGDANAARRALTAGGAVLVPADLARRAGAGPGSRLTVQTAAGIRTFHIAATYTRVGFYEQMGIVISSADAGGILDDRGRTELRIAAADGRHDAVIGQVPEAVIEAVVGAAAGRTIPSGADWGVMVGGSGSGGQAVDVRTVDDLVAAAQGQLERFLRLTGAIVGVAVVVGILGLANTLLMTGIRRTRELALLRAVGLSSRQARTLVTAEAATLCLAAAVVAIPLGTALSAIISRSNDISVNPVPTAHALAASAPVVALALVVAIAASAAPRRRAGRLDIVDALRLDS